MARKKNKTSRLTKEEMSLIKELAPSEYIEDIAIKLNRSPRTIVRYCQRNNVPYRPGSSLAEYHRLELKLHSKPYWKEVKEQFVGSELKYFVDMWVNAMLQFKEDVQYSEEIQIKQWITLEIMANKVLRDRKNAQVQMERLEQLLEKVYFQIKQVPSEEVHQALFTQAANLEQQLAMLRNAQSTYTTEHSKILQRIEKIQSELKASRADRIKKVDDSKTSWSGLIKLLEDEEQVRRLGEEAELMRLAKNAAKKRLSQPHVYMDGKVDQPYLTTDTAIDFENVNVIRQNPQEEQKDE